MGCSIMIDYNRNTYMKERVPIALGIAVDVLVVVYTIQAQAGRQS